LKRFYILNCEKGKGKIDVEEQVADEIGRGDEIIPKVFTNLEQQTSTHVYQGRIEAVLW